MQEWNLFWPEFLDRERLNNNVSDMDLLDKANKKDKTTEEICKGVYLKYDKTDENHLEFVRSEFLKKIDKISHVHLSTSRVKTIESILRKIITKRYEAYFSKTSPYASITEDTYQDALTDLVGVRVILSYRGDWCEIHKALVALFPLKSKEVYKNGILHHESNDTFMAEWPKVYYASGDDISTFEAQGLEAKLHKKGYRSIHYTISFMNTYIELQVRTIYDEAWSDVDHRYVYKQEANPSNEALKELSYMLCQLTNLSNDIGEQMRAVFDGDKMSRTSDSGKWVVTKECRDFFVSVIERLDSCQKAFQNMNSRMVFEEELNPENSD